MPLSLALILLTLLLNQVSPIAPARQLVDPDAAQLAKVSIFAFGGIGFAGARSTGEREYDAILSRPNRQELFEQVLAAGTPEAQSYALVGLANLNDARFKTLSATPRSSKSAVHIARGCIIGRSTLAAIIQQIDAGQYREQIKQ